MLGPLASKTSALARNHPRERRLSRCWLLPAIGLWSGCVALPPPPTTEDLSSVGPAYDNPTAELPARETSVVLDNIRPYLNLAASLDGLTLLRTAVSDSSAGLHSALPEDSLTVQGTIKARLSCPGHDALPTDDIAQNGSIDLTLGIEKTRIQRAFAGAARDCRFISGRGEVRMRVTFSAELTADLGADVAIGDEAPDSLTVQLRGLDIHSLDSELALPKLQDAYNFRVRNDESIEVLLDLDALDLAALSSDVTGTVVLIGHADGSVGIRDHRGEWRCTRDNPCLFSNAQ